MLFATQPTWYGSEGTFWSAAVGISRKDVTEGIKRYSRLPSCTLDFVAASSNLPLFTLFPSPPSLPTFTQTQACQKRQRQGKSLDSAGYQRTVARVIHFQFAGQPRHSQRILCALGLSARCGAEHKAAGATRQRIFHHQFRTVSITAKSLGKGLSGLSGVEYGFSSFLSSILGSLSNVDDPSLEFEPTPMASSNFDEPLPRSVSAMAVPEYETDSPLPSAKLPGWSSILMSCQRGTNPSSLTPPPCLCVPLCFPPHLFLLQKTS